MKPLYCEETAWLASMRQRKSLEPKAAGNPDFDFSFFIQTRQKARVIGSSLVIDVIGPLYGDGVPLNEALGGTNYQSIVEEIKAAAGNIDEVIFVFDSPGGDVQGCHETAELIKSLPVETVAYVKGMCCSAAYYLASACDQVIVTETALVGSIGTVISLWNAKSEEILTITNDDAVFKTSGNPNERGGNRLLQGFVQQDRRTVSGVCGFRTPRTFCGCFFPARSLWWKMLPPWA